MSFAFVILVLMAFFCAVAFRQQLKRDKVNAGGQDELIKKVLSRYRKLRDNPKALAVRILDEKGKRRDGATDLGMEVLEVKEQFFYQFPVELEKEMENAELVAVLTRIKQKIEERYPDDFVGRAPNYLTVVIDGKKLLKHLDG